MIRDSSNGVYTALLTLPDASGQSEQDDAITPDAATSTSSSATPSQDDSVSWVRHFFQPVEDGKFQKCLLEPEPGVRSPQKHSLLIANSLKSMKRHINDSLHHQRAWKKYSSLASTSMPAEKAAQETIVFAREISARSIISFPTNTPTGDAKLNRLRSEIALLCYTAEEGIPFSGVSESRFFTEYHASISSRAPPNRKRLSGCLLHLVYQLVKDHQAAEMKDLDYFSITTDSATSYGSRLVALTVHFVHPASWKLHSFVLGLIPMTTSQKWDVLTKAISNRLAYDLPLQAVLVATVTDGGSNFVKLAASLHTNLVSASIEGLGVDSWDEPVPNSEDLDITAAWHCVAHRAQLAALDVLGAEGIVDGSVRNLLGDVRNLITHIRGSPVVNEQLRKIQITRNKSSAVPVARFQASNLQVDVPTRWLYTHRMLESFLKLYNDVLALALHGYLDQYDGYIPTIEDVRILNAIFTVLGPLADFVRLCEGEKYTTIAMVPVRLKKFFATASIAVDDAAIVKRIKEKLGTAVMNRLGYILKRPNLALAAAALHPAYGHLRFVEPSVRDDMWAELAVWLADFSPIEIPQISQNRSAGPRLPDMLPLDRSLCVSQLRKIREAFESDVPDDPLDTRDASEELRQKFDPLLYWARVAKDRPQLADVCRLARIVFCVPASSAPSERVFSALNNIIGDKNSRLLDYKREMLTVIRMHTRKLQPKEFLDFCIEKIRENKRKLDVTAGDDDEDDQDDDE